MQAYQIRPYTAFDEQELAALYRSVGWVKYCETPGLLSRAYRSSLCALGAYRGDALVGAVRAVGDGCSVLYVQDLLVAPAHQRQGIGRRLLEELLGRCPGVGQVVLLTDDTPATAAFYESVGLYRAERFGCVSFVKFG